MNSVDANQKFSQDSKHPKEIPILKSRGIDSELTGANLDLIFHEAESAKGNVLILSRLGEKEKSQTLHHRRLHNVIGRLTYSGSRLSKDRIISAIGERSSAKALIEIYLNGELRFVCEIDHGKDIRVDCCEIFPQYYPWYRGKSRLKF